MATRDIQEMLDGMLNDEQAAEVLHRLSVSPEKLSAFRQHMALQEAMEEDARAGGLEEEEDDAVWAAVLGATGGLVTGGAAVGASGWLAKAAAFLVTGLAGFLIGAAVDGTFLTNEEPAIAETTQQATVEPAIPQTTPSSSATPVISKVDTVVQTVIEYRDRVEYKYIERPVAERTTQTNENPAAMAVAETLPDNDKKLSASQSESNVTSSRNSNSPAAQMSRSAQQSLTALGNRNNMLGANAQSEKNMIADASKDNNGTDATLPQDLNTNPDALLNSSRTNSMASEAESSESRSPSRADEPSPDDKTKNSISLLKNGWELGYNERMGRITPPPTVRDESQPDFGGRSIDLTARMLKGRVGIGARVFYGSFSSVTLSEQIQNIGFADTVLVPSLETSPEFNLEVFANYRIPLFTERLALGLEGSFGLSSSRFKVGGDVSVVYLITEWLGAQGGVGYGAYRYTTQQERENALKEYENASITDDFIDSYQGTMVEGRYGLFFRF